MFRRSEDQHTIPELGPRSGFPDGESTSGKYRIVPQDTMWQARLVLSTLDPKGLWAGRLRLAIRQGNSSLVQVILSAVYEQRAAEVTPFSAEEESTSHSVRPVVRSTMLPPAGRKQTG